MEDEKEAVFDEQNLNKLAEAIGDKLRLMLGQMVAEAVAKAGEQDRLISIKEAATMLGRKSSSAVYSRISKGQLSLKQPGRVSYFEVKRLIGL